MVLIKKAQSLMTGAKVESAYFKQRKSQQNVLCGIQCKDIGYKRHISYMHYVGEDTWQQCVAQACVQGMGRLAPLTLSLRRLLIDDLMFLVFPSNFFELSYKISLQKNRFVTLYFIRFS